MRASKIKIGCNYGQLRVVALHAHRDNYGYRLWECVCSCGGSKIVNGRNLLMGYTRSCGCLLRESSRKLAKKLVITNKKEPGTSALNSLYTVYKNRARARLLSFELERDTFKNIVTTPCAYCGSPPKSIFKVRSGNDSTAYNGIDRINNSFGYVAGNVASCCRVCNMAKGVLTRDEFKKWIMDVYIQTICS